MEDDQDDALFARLEDPATSLEELRAIHEEHPLEDAVSSALASHPNADEALLLAILESEPPRDVLFDAARNPAASAVLLSRLARSAEQRFENDFDAWSSLREQLAQHPNADGALLEELALYPDEWVQRAVLEHPNTTAAAARRVLETAEDDEVLAAAKALKQRLTPSS